MIRTLNAHIRAAVVYGWMAAMSYSLPAAAQGIAAVPNLADGLKHYDIEFLGWCVLVAVVGGCGRTVLTLLSAIVVLEVVRETWKDLLIAALAGAVACLMLAAVQSLGVAITAPLEVLILAACGWPHAPARVRTDAVSERGDTKMSALAVTLAALIALALAAIAYAQARARTGVALKVNALDISAQHKSAALAYFNKAAAQAPLWSVLRDHIIAPLVLIVPLLRLPREADDLPDTLAHWRNDVSINGDGWGWQDAQGQWHQCSVEPAPPGIAAMRYADPAYGGDAYYAPGHHPRSFWARFVWLAFRNVASKDLQEAGPLVETRPILLAGAPLASSYTPGFALFWNGDSGDGAAYGWHAIDRWGPLALWTNVGAKLGVPYSWPELMPCRAMLTGTWRAFKWAGAKA
jgi:hypothetical protein